MQISEKQTANTALFGIYRLLLTFFSVFTLYVAQSIIIPLALAALFTFMLSPLVTLLERWLGRILSILLVVLVVFTLLGFLGYAFAKQFAVFGANFQTYYEKIQLKLQSIQLPQNIIFDRIGHAYQTVKEGLFGTDMTDGASKLSQMDLKLLDIGSNFADFAKYFFGSVFSMLGMTALVVLLVVFMLLNQEDIKSRLIKLAGQGKIGAATTALDDASDRVFQYLIRLLIVNIGFGVSVAVGLHIIGLPNAVLWGCLAGILRFIPYLGAWIAALLPIILSFIIADSWMMPLVTMAFFILLETFTAYVVEPFYYGEGTGVSAFALILAAIFWTWLWGPIGLLLSTPLTVCLVVLGQYATNLSFLRILLSKEEPLTPAEECYHRLLSFDSNESMDVIESYLKKNSINSLYDAVLVPIITQAEMDDRRELIDTDKKEAVYQSINEIIEYLSVKEEKEKEVQAVVEEKVLCIPARSKRDEIGVNILTQLLTQEAFQTEYTKSLGMREIQGAVEEKSPNIVCIVSVAPFDYSYIRYICAKLHERKPQLPIVICLFGAASEDPNVVEKFTSAGATKVAFNLAQTANVLKEIRSSK